MLKEPVEVKNVKITPDGYLIKDGCVMTASLANGSGRDIDFLERFLIRWRHYFKPRLHQPDKLLQDFWGQPKSHIGNGYVWVTNNWSNGYYHWVADSLPRLVAGEESLTGRKLLLPANFKDKEYIRTSLISLGVDSIRYINHNHPTIVDDLIILPRINPFGVCKKSILKILRSRVRSYFSESIDKNSSNRIYISRSKAKRRHVVNESELVSCIREYGFEVVNLENFSWSRQIKKIANSQIIIGPHGAGLVNVIFMNKGGKVLELTNQNHYNNCYKLIANKLNLNYSRQKCEATRDNPIFSKSSNKDIFVDLDLLQNKLSDLTDL